MSQKEKNRELLDQCANAIGDNYLQEMFWSMFEDLSVAKQKVYIECAVDIVRRQIPSFKLDK